MDQDTAKKINKLTFEYKFATPTVMEYINKLGEEQVLLIIQNIIAEAEEKEKAGLQPSHPASSFRNTARRKYSEKKQRDKVAAEFNKLKDLQAAAKKESEVLHGKGFVATNEAVAGLLMDWYKNGKHKEGSQPRSSGNIEYDIQRGMNFLGYDNVQIAAMGIAVVNERLDISDQP